MGLELIPDCRRKPAEAHHGYGVWKEYSRVSGAEMIKKALRIDNRVGDQVGVVQANDAIRFHEWQNADKVRKTGLIGMLSVN
ncbi:MAG: hypothetical protein E5W86_06575 [Mesorhizobium sp.]|nr:MAG: hypothetical protein E5W86_06575 [Mesorhizobium sp.]